MQNFTLEVNETLQIGDDTEVSIIEITDEYVRIAIRSESVSPYYWEEMLSLEDSDSNRELLYS